MEIGQCELFFTKHHKTQVTWWVLSWLHNLFFIKERLLNVFSSSTNPNTWKPLQSLSISCSYWAFHSRWQKKSFLHNLEIRFKLKCLAIILFALCDITILKNEDYISNNQEGGTIISFVILGATQYVNLIRFKCKRNELFLLQ
jgi:hypothetical protein